MDKFLQYENLSYFYQTKESEIHALNNVNFFVKQKTNCKMPVQLFEVNTLKPKAII